MQSLLKSCKVAADKEGNKLTQADMEDQDQIMKVWETDGSLIIGSDEQRIEAILKDKEDNKSANRH